MNAQKTTNSPNFKRIEEIAGIFDKHAENHANEFDIFDPNTRYNDPAYQSAVNSLDIEALGQYVAFQREATRDITEPYFGVGTEERVRVLRDRKWAERELNAIGNAILQQEIQGEDFLLVREATEMNGGKGLPIKHALNALEGDRPQFR